VERYIESDLGCSSKYSNECIYIRLPFRGNGALKTEVEKVSLSSADAQGLVGPKEGT